MTCRICFCKFDETRFNKLPNVYNWKDLLHAIDSLVLVETEYLQDICVDCYQKLEKFNDFRQLQGSERWKLRLSDSSCCLICRIIVSNGTNVDREEYLAQKQCMKLFFPDMIFNIGETSLVCQPCLAVLTEFDQFWRMLLVNNEALSKYPKPSQQRICGERSKCTEVAGSAREPRPKFQTYNENWEVQIKEEPIDPGFNWMCNSSYEETEVVRDNEEGEEGDEEMEDAEEERDGAATFRPEMSNVKNTYEQPLDDAKTDQCEFADDTKESADQMHTKGQHDSKDSVKGFVKHHTQLEKPEWTESGFEEEVNKTHIEEFASLENSAKEAPSNSRIKESGYPEITIQNEGRDECIKEYNCVGTAVKSETIEARIKERDDWLHQNTMNQTIERQERDCSSLKVEDHDPSENAPGKYRIKPETPEGSAKVPHVCHYCSKKCSNQGDLLKHHKTKHRSQPLVHPCPLCPFTTTRRKYLTRHHYYNHKQNFILHSCPLCNFQTKRSGHLKNHLNKHYGTATHRCPHCDFATKWPFSLKCHITAKHDDTHRFLQCPKCEYKTKFPNELNKHMRYKHDKASNFLKCPKCDFRSHFQAWLNRHVKCQHPDVERTYRCQLCDFQTRLAASLAKHTSTVHAEGDAVFHKCPSCDHRTKYRGNLRMHQRLKHEEDVERVQCAQCEFQTRAKADLVKHLRYKHGDAPRLACPHCTHTTVRLGHLMEHVRRQHTGNPRMYQCSGCDHRTKYPANLRQHQLFRHGGTTELYACGLCRHTTKYRYNLKGHYRVCHGLEGVSVGQLGKIERKE